MVIYSKKLCKNFLLKYLMFLLLILMSVSQPALSKTIRIIEKMRAIDGVTLESKDYRFILWGIRPLAEGVNPSQLKALDLLDSLMGREKVNCKIIHSSSQRVTARCLGYTDVDLGLELINQGLAVIDRRQMDKSVFSQIYISAQNLARENRKGIWNNLERKVSNNLLGQPKVGYFSTTSPIFALMLGLLVGLLISFILMRLWLNKLLSLQKDEIKNFKQKELIVYMREKNILISVIKGELLDNKDKVTAFLSIYRELLRRLEDDNINTDNKNIGEVIQKHPALNRGVFESNLNKFSILDINVSGEISRIYEVLPKEHEYINLASGVDTDKAIIIIGAVLENANNLLSLIDNGINLMDKESELLEKSILKRGAVSIEGG